MLYAPKAQGSLPPGPHALYVRRRARTSLGRAVRTAYRGTPGAKLLVPGLTVMHIGYSADSAMPLAAASLGVLTFNVCGNMIITAPLSAMDTVRLLWPSSSALAY